MNTSEMELPKHLYTETTAPCGTMIKVIIEPDMLISWSEEGRGDAITRLCHNVYERKIEAIDAWESDRILQLEDEGIAAGNDEDVTEKRYHLTCETVVQEAEKKRASTREWMTEHKTAVEILVQEAREFIAAHETPPQEDNLVAFLLAIGAIVAAGYVLLYNG